MGDPIGVRDDGTHEHGREPGWTERIQFAFFDGASECGGIARTEFRPLDGVAHGSLNVFVGDGAVATVLAREETPGGGTSVGRIQMDRHAPLERWRLRCKDVALVLSAKGGRRAGVAAQIDAELTFDAWSPPAGSASRDKRTDDLGFVQVVSSGHFEQAGRFSGRLRVGGRAVTIEGSGVRVRSWGARDRTAQHREAWFAVAFGPTLAIGVRAVTLGDRHMHHGWIFRDGELRDVRALHVETVEAGREVERVALEVTDAAGERCSVEGSTLASIPLNEGGTRVRQAMTLYRCGDQEALGLGEYAGGEEGSGASREATSSVGEPGRSVRDREPTGDQGPTREG